MEPELLPGDIILVSKMSYGARLLNPVKFFKHKQIEYVRTKGWGPIKKGDIFVFNWPRYNISYNSGLSIYGGFVVKRCYGLPGDSVLIKNIRINNERIADIQQIDNLFPHDSLLDWSLNNYGPLYVPAKGRSMKLTKRNVCWYKDILLYENPNSYIKDSSLIEDDNPVLQYTFQHNYYFMLGDNFYNSEDSRYWGFVPDGNVISKVAVVLFSIDPNGYGLNKFRWSRVLKIIKNMNH